MPVTSIDVINAFTPPRAAEAPRAGDVNRPFAPALEQAYKDDRPREVRPAKKEEPAKEDSSPPPARGIHCFPQPVPNEIQGDDRNHDGDTWEESDPRRNAI